ALPFTVKDAVRFQELQNDLAPLAAVATKYLDKARRLGCDSPYCHGLSALALGLLARQPEPASWAAVGEAAGRALSGWASITDAAAQGRKPAIEYVSAIAASRTRDAAAAARNRQAIA